MEWGAAIVLLSPSSCKSQIQQFIKENRIPMKEKLKTMSLESHKSRNTYLTAHKSLDSKSS